LCEIEIGCSHIRKSRENIIVSRIYCKFNKNRKYIQKIKNNDLKYIEFITIAQNIDICVVV